MAAHLVVYTVIHQPRRLKLPAQPIPRGASPEDIARCLFDERMNERYFRKVAHNCYYPAVEMFLRLLERGFKLCIGFSLSFIRQAQQWDPPLLERFKTLVRHPNCELVGVEPYHSFLFYLDIDLFTQRMAWAAEELQRLFGLPQRPQVTDTTEMIMANDIYFALLKAGFRGALLDGRPYVMEWRQPTYLYHYGGPLKLLARHHQLSDDVGYRFSNRSWAGWPLLADTYAHWIRAAAGDFVVIGWDFETFGEHHGRHTGIFEFMDHLPEALARAGVAPLKASEAIERFSDRSHFLPLPDFPSTWAGIGGLEFFLGNEPQQAIFRQMHHAYHKARLVGDPELLDLALWLAQSDNLHLIQWWGRQGSEAEVSAYFTPREWWQLGPNGIIRELIRVYGNFVRALDPHALRRLVPLPAQPPQPAAVAPAPAARPAPAAVGDGQAHRPVRATPAEGLNGQGRRPAPPAPAGTVAPRERPALLTSDPLAAAWLLDEPVADEEALAAG